jgi:hypothetical protein
LHIAWQVMLKVWSLVAVVTTPVVPRVMTLLRVNLGGEDFLPDDRDPELDTFGHVRLKYDRTQSNRGCISDIAL